MSEFRTGSEGGLSKIQGGFQPNRINFQQSQELTNVKNQVEQLSIQKGKLLMELGQAIYLEYRKGLLEHEEVFNRAPLIQELDRAIYKHMKTLENMSTASGAIFTCECGATVSESDEFCPNCGSKVMKPEIEYEAMKHCEQCQHEIPLDSIYCQICGSQT